MQKKKTLNDVEIRIGKKTTTTGRTDMSEEKIETGKVMYDSTCFLLLSDDISTLENDLFISLK